MDASIGRVDGEVEVFDLLVDDCDGDVAEVELGGHKWLIC